MFTLILRWLYSQRAENAAPPLSAYLPISSSSLLPLLFYFSPSSRFNEYPWFIRPVFADVSRFFLVACTAVLDSVWTDGSLEKHKGSCYTIPAVLQCIEMRVVVSNFSINIKFLILVILEVFLCALVCINHRSYFILHNSSQILTFQLTDYSTNQGRFFFYFRLLQLHRNKCLKATSISLFI